MTAQSNDNHECVFCAFIPPQVTIVYIYNKARLLDAQKWAQQHAVGCSEVGTAVPLSDAQKWARQGAGSDAQKWARSLQGVGCSEVGTATRNVRCSEVCMAFCCWMLRSGHSGKAKGPRSKNQNAEEQRPKGQ